MQKQGVLTKRDDRKYSKIAKRFARRVKKGRVANGTVTIVKYDGIGDFVLFLDAAKGLRELYKDKKIILTCSRLVKDWAMRSGCFDEVVVFRKHEFEPECLKQTLEKAKLLRCETLLHVSFSRDIASEILAAFVEADEKITVPNTFVYEDEVFDWFADTYDRTLNIPLDMMCIQQNRQIVRELGNPNFTSSFPVLPPVPKTHLYLPTNYYVLFLGGSAKIKQWGAENYYEVVKYLNARTDYRCVLSGAKEEMEYEEYFKGKDVPYYSYLGKTSIDELQELIANAKFVVGNDTSAMHMAASLGVPSICVSSAASSKRFYPYDVDNAQGGVAPICVKKEVECAGCSFDKRTFLKCFEGRGPNARKACVEDVTVAEVIEKMESLLAGLNVAREQ